MHEVKIKQISTLQDLRNEIAGFSNVALDTVQTLKQHINEQYNEMRDIAKSLQEAQKEAYQAYLLAKEALDECKNDCWEDEDEYIYYYCSVEIEEKEDAWHELKRVESDLNRAKEIVRKASDWLRSFNSRCQKFQSLAGNCSRDSVRYLSELFNLAQQYVSLSSQYGVISDNDTTTNSTLLVNSAGTIPQNKSDGFSYDNQAGSNSESASVLINFYGTPLFLKTTKTKNANNKEFTTWNIATKNNPDENLLSLKMNNESKHATLGDVKTKDSFWNISKESDAIALMEKTAKNEGCKTIGSWVSNTQVSFFAKNGYEIISENDSGAEIYKKL